MESLIGVSPVELALVFIVVAIASLLRSFTGFGFALAAVPGFSLIFPPTDAVVLSASLALTISLFSLPTYWQDASIKPMLPMLTAAVLATFVGASLLSYISVRTFQLLVSASIFFALFGLLLNRSSSRRRSLPLECVAGAASGLMNGVLAIPGPPVIAYAMLTQPDPVRSRAMLMVFFMLSGFIALVSFSFAGFVRKEIFLLFVLSLPTLYVFDKLGYVLFLRYSDKFYRTVAMWLLFVMGLSIGVNAWF
ncbi:MAG: sulfite exporter TauE/SafE family protein [Pseudomonadales bacterium]